MSNVSDNYNGDISLREVIIKIKSTYDYFLIKWIVILLGVVIGGLLGLAYAFIKKPVYTAELTFALQDANSSGSLSSALGLASQFGIDLGGGSSGGEFSGDNLLELMKSRLMVERALLTAVNVDGKKQTLAELYIKFNNLRKNWAGKPELESVQFIPGADIRQFSLKQDSVLGVFQKTLISKNLTVEKIDKKLNIISLKVNSTNELFSKYFTEILAKDVSDFYIQTKIKKGRENVSILQRQTDSVRRALNSAITGVASSIDANPNPNPLVQTLRVPSQRRQIDVQANSAILNELVKNLELAKMSLLQETPLIQVIDSPILPLEKEKTSKLVGLVTGSVIGLLLVVTVLFFRKLLKNVMSVTD